MTTKTQQLKMKPAQRLLGCLFCLLSEIEEVMGEKGRETGSNPSPKTVLCSAKDKGAILFLQIFHSEERCMLVL